MRPRCIRDAYAFRRILGDMTGLCNLRCRFCSSDFRQASRAVMPLPLARGLPRLFDLVPEASFFLSFFYEPTLHPHFGEILAGLPPLARQKAVFSTNMACEMDDAAIAALAAAPVRRIIISLHTLQPELYAGLCGGRHVERLLSNLLRLGEACRAREARGEHAPPLQFHSLVLRDNYEEIPSLVQLAAERFHAAAHEVRTPVYGEHPGLPYTVRQLLTRAELESLLPRLSAAHGAVSCDFSLWRELFEQRQAAHEPLPNMRSRNSPGPVAVGKVLPQRYWDVRLDADGSAFFYGLGETCDLRELNPAAGGAGHGRAARLVPTQQRDGAPAPVPAGHAGLSGAGRSGSAARAGIGGCSGHAVGRHDGQNAAACPCPGPGCGRFALGAGIGAPAAGCLPAAG